MDWLREQCTSSVQAERCCLMVQHGARLQKESCLAWTERTWKSAFTGYAIQLSWLSNRTVDQSVSMMSVQSEAKSYAIQGCLRASSPWSVNSCGGSIGCKCVSGFIHVTCCLTTLTLTLMQARQMLIRISVHTICVYALGLVITCCRKCFC